MNKRDIIDAISKQAQLNRYQADEALTALLESIVYALSLEQDVAIAGFGRFSVKRCRARQGRNPMTGEVMTIAAHRKPVFYPTTRFKSAIQAAQHDTRRDV